MKNTGFKEKMKWVQRLVYFDENDFLREKARDRAKIQILINEAEELFHHEDDLEERFFLTGVMGNLYRVIGKINRSIGYLNLSMEIADELSDPTKKIAASIRLGEVLKYANKHQKALELFEQSILSAYEFEPGYLDFAYQHKGKCLMELENYQEAMEAFQGALALRKTKGNQELLDSTEQAVALLTKLLEEQEVYE